MIIRKLSVILTVLLLACKPQIKDFDNTTYDLYLESQFANGFALIKDNYGKRLDPHYNGHNYADGIMNASVMFGEMDLLSIKDKVIARMKMPETDILQNEEGIWRPLYDGVRQSHGHRYDKLSGWVYWIIFNPQVDYERIGADKSDGLTGIAILTAVSRAKVSYWHNQILTCMQKQLTPEQAADLHESWMDAIRICQKEYADKISGMAAEIYPKLKELPQYQEGRLIETTD